MAIKIEKPKAEIWIYYQTVAGPVVPTTFAPALLGPLYRLEKPLDGAKWTGENDLVFDVIYDPNTEVYDEEYTRKNCYAIINDTTVNLPYSYFTVDNASIDSTDNKITFTLRGVAPKYISLNDYVIVDSPLIEYPLKVTGISGVLYTQDGVTVEDISLTVDGTIPTDLSNTRVYLAILAPELTGNSIKFYARKRTAWTATTGITITTHPRYSGNVVRIVFATWQDAYLGDRVSIVGNVNTSGTVVDISIADKTIYIVPDAELTSVSSVSFSPTADNIQQFGDVEIKVVARFRKINFAELPLVVGDENAFYDEYSSSKANPDPDNPIAEAISWIRGVTRAPIYIYPVPEDTVNGYSSVLDDLGKERDSYVVVPLTTDRSIIQAVASAVEELNNPSKSIIKRLVAGQEIDDYFVVDTSTAEAVGSVDSNGYTIFTVSYATAISVNDKIKVTRYKVGANEYNRTSNPIWLTVIGVTGNNVRVAERVGAITLTEHALAKPYKQAKSAIKSSLSSFAEGFGSVHVSLLLGNVYGIAAGNYVKTSIIYACCAYAGMISAYPAQVHFNLKPIPGIQKVERTWDFFTEDELSELAGSGWTLLVQDAKGDIPYIRNSLTTDTSSILTRNLSITKSVDFVARTLWTLASAIIKQGYNITDNASGAIFAIKINMDAALNYLTKGTRVDRYGPVLVDGRVANITTSGETVTVDLDLTFPKPLGKIRLNLYVS